MAQWWGPGLMEFTHSAGWTAGPRVQTQGCLSQTRAPGTGKEDEKGDIHTAT